MEIFDYKGRNKRGEILQGSIESPSSQAVAKWMVDSGIFPIHIEVQARKNPVKQLQWLDKLLGNDALPLRDLLLFTRQMGTMVKASVPMMQALAGIEKSSVNPLMIEILHAVRADLDKGVELSTALSRHPKCFNDYYVNMIKVGESSGQLEEIFKRLHAQLEFEKHMSQKIKGALRYPTFVIIAISIAIGILTVFVIPKFSKIYAKMHASLPFTTQLLLDVSAFAVDYWWIVLTMIAGGIYAFKLYVSRSEGRYQWDKLKLRMPIIGNILKKAALARFCHSFATASKSGVPLVQAFTLVARVVDNAFYEDRILLMRDGVERGESILRVAQTADIFMPLELQMISVGEATGDIDGMLNEVADMYQEEVDYEVGRLSESVEPILLAFIGAVVAILMLGIFMPLWNMGQAATQH